MFNFSYLKSLSLLLILNLLLACSGGFEGISHHQYPDSGQNTQTPQNPSNQEQEEASAPLSYAYFSLPGFVLYQIQSSSLPYSTYLTPLNAPRQSVYLSPNAINWKMSKDRRKFVYTNYSKDRLYLIDLTQPNNPSSPTQLFYTGAGHDGIDGIQGVQLSEDDNLLFFYIANPNTFTVDSAALYAVDISDPSHPSLPIQINHPLGPNEKILADSYNYLSGQVVLGDGVVFYSTYLSLDGLTASDWTIYGRDISNFPVLGAPQVIASSPLGYARQIDLSWDKEKLFFIAGNEVEDSHLSLYMTRVDNFPAVGPVHEISGPKDPGHSGFATVSQYFISKNNQTLVYVSNQDINEVFELYWSDISNPDSPSLATKVHEDLLGPGDINSPIGQLPKLRLNDQGTLLYYQVDGDLYRASLNPIPLFREPHLIAENAQLLFEDAYLNQEGIVYFKQAEEIYSINTSLELPMLLDLEADNFSLLRHQSGKQLIYAENGATYTLYQKDLNGEALPLSDPKPLYYPKSTWKTEGPDQVNNDKTAYFFIADSDPSSATVPVPSIFAIDLEGSKEVVLISPKGLKVKNFKIY
ncbi:MAG: hypothetical protein KDK66_02290 [Deltaproteobacteria bacterium]|nr:hypothetical protein [Deltaproteobacteria bacterium]